MLVLSRKVGERIFIGDGITVTLVAVHGKQIRLGIEAPPSISIRREELKPRREAAAADAFQETRGPDWYSCQWDHAGEMAHV